MRDLGITPQEAAEYKISQEDRLTVLVDVGGTAIENLSIPNVDPIELGRIKLLQLIQFAGRTIARRKVKAAIAKAVKEGKDTLAAANSALDGFDYSTPLERGISGVHKGKGTQLEAILAEASNLSKEDLLAEIERINNERKERGKAAAAKRKDRQPVA